MDEITLSLGVIFLFLLFTFYHSQNKFQNKMLCSFIRPNLQEIEKWVPLKATSLIFDQGKYGIARYRCDPHCIRMIVYKRGIINKLFPTLVPKLEFKWDTPNPLNPRTFQSTWHTPEVEEMGSGAREFEAFAKGVAQQAGEGKKLAPWFWNVVIIALILILAYMMYTSFQGLDMRLFNLEQLSKLGQ